MIKVSPRHQITLNDSFLDVVKKPRAKDYSIFTIARKNGPNGDPLITTELVVAGQKTQKEFSLAKKYPVHFLKQYSVFSFHGDPEEEFKKSQVLAKILDQPQPIGFDEHSFRTCFIPGKTVDRVSPFGVEPWERNVDIAQELPHPHLLGLWNLLENVYASIVRLHDAGWVHGDLEKHNVILSLAPWHCFLIDFESATAQKDFDSEEEWEEACREDLQVWLRESIYIQSVLGRQSGALADRSLAEVERLFDDAEVFLEGIHQLPSF